MNIKNRLFLLSLASMLALLANLAFPNIAFADDETPPPVATGEPVQPPGEQPTEEPVSDPAMAIEQETLIPEVVGELPDGTEIVLLNEDGEAEPLATEEAAELLVNGDPMWCPSGVLPGGSGCTSSFTSFTDLITELTSFPGTYIGAGTIYVAWDYDATVTPDAGTDIIFDYGDVGLTDLVFQGGWDFGSNAVVGTSDLTGINSLQFWDWGAFGFPASLTLNDITLNGGDGLYIGYDSSGTTSGVTLDNVTVEDTNNGTYIETDGNVSIINSTFNDNDSDGLRVVSGGNITLEDVTASGNDGYGAFLDGCNCSGDSDIKITGTNEFNENEEGGLFAATTGDVHIEGVTASSNDGMGLYAEADGDITLKNVTANYNYYNGPGWITRMAPAMWIFTTVTLTRTSRI